MSRYRKEFITANGGRVELDPRRARIKKGMYLISEAPSHRGEFVRIPEHFESHATSIAEIVRRLQMVRAGLDADTRTRKK